MIAVFATVLFKEDRGLVQILSNRAWLAVAVTGLAWPLLGWLLGGLDDGDRRAFAITAGSRELALALVLASLAFSTNRGVHTALFGIWSLYAIVSILIAAGMRALPKVRARGRGREVPAGARSAPAR